MNDAALRLSQAASLLPCVQYEYFVISYAESGVDRAESEPSKVSLKWAVRMRLPGVMSAVSAADCTRSAGKRGTGGTLPTSEFVFLIGWERLGSFDDQ